VTHTGADKAHPVELFAAAAVVVFGCVPLSVMAAWWGAL
jgi:hypothetical protein